MEDGRYSVAFPRRWWYPACRSADLAAGPVAVTLMDTPLALFRAGHGRPAAVLDRCPHRNYPLSAGRVRPDGTLECGYHGWRFDGCGDCVGVPGLDLTVAPASATRRVPSHAVCEQDGFVWVWGETGAEPTGSPFGLPELGGTGTGEVVLRRDLDCTMHAALENSLDVPHTAFLHRGLFRGAEPHRVTAVRRPLDDGVEVQYLGEPAGMGPIRLRADSERTFDHWDRFFLPCVAQIEYAVDRWFRIVNTIVHLPLSPFRTRAWFVVRWWSRLPATVVDPVVRLRGRQILAQDAAALARQTAQVRRCGGERFTSTEMDVLGTAVWRLLRQAERAEGAGAQAGDGDSDGDDRGDGDVDSDGDPLARTMSFEV